MGRCRNQGSDCGMIHKHHQILSLFAGDYQKELYGRELIGKVNISQKGIALALEELERRGILKSRKAGNMKFYSLNLKNPNIKDILAVTELNTKTLFLGKYKTLAHIFREDTRMVGIFGSYAKETEKPGSDIDVFIVGKKKQKDYGSEGKTFDLNISIKYFTEEQFKQLLRSKNVMVKEIIENHILLFNVELFIKQVWEEYYGFD